MNSGQNTIDCDVAVVGYGGAGACAAITAHDRGASVVILEKMTEPGGNTRLSNCSWFCPPPGMEEQAIQHIEALCLGRTDRAVIEAYVRAASGTKAWLEGFGASTKTTRMLGIRYPQVTHPSWPNFPGAAAMTNHTVASEREEQPPGERLFGLLANEVERRGITVLTGTPARRLLANEAREVTGVLAERGGTGVTVRARRAVVLACGGFEYNEAMKELYLPVMPFHPIGSPGNTGDGITMARELGAALWHMGVVVGGLGFKAEDVPTPFPISYAAPGFLYVNKAGRRFTNETGWEVHFGWQALQAVDPRRPGYPTLPVYGICDAETLRKGALSAGILSAKYRWSADNSVEVAKGWIREGRTPAELAAKIGMDGAVLEKTIRRYNDHCKAGVDPDFHRPKETLKALDTPPFYAVELWPWMVNTMGGPRRDARARVLDESGRPIARLYSAGELGSLWGHFYCGGGNVGEALAVGRIAGENAAAEQPRP